MKKTLKKVRKPRVGPIEPAMSLPLEVQLLAKGAREFVGFVAVAIDSEGNLYSGASSKSAVAAVAELQGHYEEVICGDLSCLLPESVRVFFIGGASTLDGADWKKATFALAT